MCFCIQKVYICYIITGIKCIHYRIKTPILPLVFLPSSFFWLGTIFQRWGFFFALISCFAGLSGRRFDDLFYRFLDRFFNGSGGRTRTDDLRFMGPVSCRCSTPRYFNTRDIGVYRATVDTRDKLCSVKSRANGFARVLAAFTLHKPSLEALSSASGAHRGAVESPFGRGATILAIPFILCFQYSPQRIAIALCTEEVDHIAHRSRRRNRIHQRTNLSTPPAVPYHQRGSRFQQESPDR